MNVPKPVAPKVNPDMVKAKDPNATDDELFALMEKGGEVGAMASARLAARQKAAMAK